MEYLTLIGTVVLVHLLAVVSPGPDLVIAIKNALTYSRKTGVFTAIGFGAGISVHIFYCLAGIGLLISQSIILFNIIKLLGAAYLIFIGIQSFISKNKKIKIDSVKKQKDISSFSAFKIGFLTNALNPKATLFFLSLFTLVISPETPNLILFLLSFIMILNTILWFSFVSLVLTQPKIQAKFLRFQAMFNKIFGGLLVALGVKIALATND